MKKWMALGLGLALSAGLTPRLGAQIPGGAVPAAGGAAAAAGGAAGAAGGAAGAAGGATGMVGGFLGQLMALNAACKDKLCASPLGALLTNSLAPVSALSGGLISSCCPTVPTDAAIAAAAQSSDAEGAAAAIKKDTAEAKARRAAARYLGTVDCHWWPEAQDGLIKLLRADKNECVRLEAALALGRGCCCTKPVILTLLIVIKGGEEDGNPSENSDRVKAAAAASLAHCLSCYYEVTRAGAKPPPDTELTKLMSPAKGPLAAAKAKKLSPFAQEAQAIPMDKLMAEANLVLSRTTTSHTNPGGVIQSGGGRGKSVYEVIAQALASRKTSHKLQEMLAPVPAEQPATPYASSQVASRQEPPLEEMPAPHVEPAKVMEPAKVVATAPHPEPAKVAEPAKVMEPAKVVATAPHPEPAKIAEPAKHPEVLPPCPPEVKPVSHQEPAKHPEPTRHEEPAKHPEPTGHEEPLPVRPAPVSSPTPVDRSYPASSYCPSRSGPAVSMSFGAKAEPAPPEPPPGAIVTHHQMLALLKESMYPEQREWAAENMSSFDWRLSPEIVDGLLACARKDSVAAVRVACIRCLVKMSAGTAPVVAALESLKSDSDPRVRTEAEQALSTLKPHPAIVPLTQSRREITTKASFGS
jgi:hypothetical protein